MGQNRKKIAAALTALLCTGMFAVCGDARMQSADTGSMNAVQIIAAAADTEDTRGDLNGDGSQDVADAQLLLEYYTENTLSGKQLSWDALLGKENAAQTADTEDMRGDLNGDGSQDVMDAQLLLEYYTENTLSGRQLSWNALISAKNAEVSDRTAAESLIKECMDAYLAGDSAKVMQMFGLEELVHLMGDPERTDEEYAESIVALDVKMDSYSIGEPRADAEMFAAYQEGYELLTQKLSEMDTDPEMDEADREAAAVLIKLVRPITKLYAFTVTAMIEDEPSDAEFFVTCDENGEWRMDSGIAIYIVELMDMVNTSRQTLVKSDAKSLRMAINCAAFDLETEGADIRTLDGEYHFSGADFANLTEPEYNASALTADQALAVLKYKTTLYFNDVTEMESVIFRIERGECTVTAVRRNFEDNSTAIGTYPVCEDLTENMTLQEAFEKAAALLS